MKLSQTIKNYIFITAFYSLILSFVIAFFYQYKQYSKNIELLKYEFVEQKKKEIKNEVSMLYELIKYQDLMIKQSKNSKNIDHILEFVSTLKHENSQYNFINTIDGYSLVFEGKKLEVPLKHKYPVLFNEQVVASSTLEGGFHSYKFKKPNSEKEFDKISFVKRYEPLDLIIGSGVYLDEIYDDVENIKDSFQENIIKQLQFLSILFLSILIIVFFVSKRLSNFLNLNIENLIFSFNKASTNSEPIDSSNLTYSEFLNLANNLNHALEDKNIAEKKLQNYVDIVNQNVIISTTNKQGIITDVSEAFCRISAYSKDEIIGNRHNIVRHPDTPKLFYENMWNTLLDKKEWKGEIHNLNKNGEEYWVYAIITPTLEDGEIIGFTAIITDITNKKHIEKLSITDELTGIYNRRYFNLRIDEELNRAKRDNKALALILLDIDYFKQYNDTYGHQAGDTVLKNLALVLKKRTNRASDFAFRVGGEEFAILTSLELDKAKEFANSIKKEIENLEILHKNSLTSNYITSSIGVVCSKSNENRTIEELYKQADDNLYEAKKSGRNRVVIS